MFSGLDFFELVLAVASAIVFFYLGNRYGRFFTERRSKKEKDTAATTVSRQCFTSTFYVSLKKRRTMVLHPKRSSGYGIVWFLLVVVMMAVVEDRTLSSSIYSMTVRYRTFFRTHKLMTLLQGSVNLMICTTFLGRGTHFCHL